MGRNVVPLPEGSGGAKATKRKLFVEVMVTDEEQFQEMVATLGTFGKVSEVSAKPEGPTHDAYGNAYDKGAGRTTTHDAYGNPYEK